MQTTAVCVQEEELTEAEKRFRKERGGGNYGLGTKEVQEKRYIERREAERKRRELFSDALAMYKKGDLEDVRLRQLHFRLPAPAFVCDPVHQQMLSV